MITVQITSRHLIALILLSALAGLFALAGNASAQGPQGTSPRAPRVLTGNGFTYQGQIKKSGGLVNGTCDFQFGLWDQPAAGPQYGTTQTVGALAVTDGLFTAWIDFGVVPPNTVFTGTARYLQTAVGCPSGGALTALSSRQLLSPAPMAFTLPGLYTTQNITSPNLIGGYSGNVISNTVVGGTIGGGGRSLEPNRVWGNYATIGGGIDNTASGTRATVGGGDINIASGYAATVGGGVYNFASGNYATVPGGFDNTAAGQESFAAGTQAKADHAGAFVWADSTLADFASTGTNQFLIRANGGMGVNTNNPHTTMEILGLRSNYNTLAVRGDQTTNRRTAILLRSTTGGTATNEFEIGTDLNIDNTHNFYLYDVVNGANRLLIDGSGNFTLTPSSGSCSLSNGAVGWSCSSDRGLKENFQAVAPHTILQRVSHLPISTWTVKGSTVPHLGPTAQDFYAAFGLGEDGLHINTVDAQGVALAAIQGLYQSAQEKDAQVSSLKSQVSELHRQNAALEARLAALEQSLQPPLVRGARGDPGGIDLSAALALLIGAVGTVAIARARR